MPVFSGESPPPHLLLSSKIYRNWVTEVSKRAYRGDLSAKILAFYGNARVCLLSISRVGGWHVNPKFCDVFFDAQGLGSTTSGYTMLGNCQRSQHM